jgi:hypothetical protein
MFEEAADSPPLQTGVVMGCLFFCVGDSADISVIRIERENSALWTVWQAGSKGAKNWCELTVRNGLVAWDLNGILEETGKKERRLFRTRNGTAPFLSNGRRCSKCWRANRARPIHDLLLRFPESDGRGRPENAGNRVPRRAIRHLV